MRGTLSDVQLAELVATSAEVAATRSRSAKIAALAALVARADSDELAALIGLVAGAPRQGRVGIGWATLSKVLPEPAETATLTVGDVDAALDQLLRTAGRGSADGRVRVLTELLGRATEPEQRLIGQILMGELRQGALDGLLVEAVAVAASAPSDLVRRAYMLTGDLGETAWIAHAHGVDGLAEVGLQVLRPVRPTLASTASSVRAALEATGPASVEHKLDGARIQVHRVGEEVRVFTRSLAEVTHRVPEVVKIVRRLPVHSVVLDGESLAMDEDARPRAFQETMSRFGADAPREQALRPYFFDLLEVDGRDLLDSPLESRLAELSRVAGDLRVPGELTADPVVGEAVLAQSLAAGHEGVMIKALTSSYAAGRRGSAWQKVKPVRTFDLVVLAAEWGHGRRTGWLSNLHLGARDPEGRYGEPGGFVMIGKTFKGLTDALLRWQTDTFPAYELRRTAGAVWLRPALVVEIALDGVQVSRRYPGGVALRFARVLQYRPDKSPEDADTISAVRDLLPGGS